MFKESALERFRISPRYIQDSQIFQGYTASAVPVTIKGASGQSANVFNVVDSAGTVLFAVGPTGDLVITGSTTIVADETIDGDLTVNHDLTVLLTSTLTGAVTMGNTLHVTGAVQFSNNLIVGNQLDVGGNLNVTGTFSANYVKLPVQSSNPFSGSGFGSIYSKTVTGVVELFYIDSAGSATQITGVSAGVSGPGTSTDNAISRWNGTNGDAIQNSGIVIDDSNNMTIPSASALFIGTVDTMVVHGSTISSQIEINSDTQAIVEVHTHSATLAATYYTARSRGTTALPTIVANNDIVRVDSAVAFDGTDYEQLGQARWEVDGTPGSNDMPGRYIIAVTPDGGFTPVDALTITNDLKVTLAGALSVTGHLTFEGVTSTGATGTGKLVFDGSPSIATAVLTSPTITTNIKPTADDGAALGDTTHNFSDLFLATGSVINWVNGDITITHASNTLTMAGGTLILPDSGLQMGASNPFSDSSGTLTLQNVDALDATTEATIEAAIDTLANLTSIQSHTITLANDFITAGNFSLTLTQTGATNVTLPTSGTLATTAVTSLSSLATVGTVTAGTWSSNISGATTTGDITFGENTALVYDAALSADGKYCGTVRAGTAGAALAFGDLVYLAVADSRWELTDANAQATGGDVLIGMCVLAAAGDGSATTILLQGFIRADANFPALTVGAPVYMAETAGDIVVAQPTTADVNIRRVGWAWTADEIYFNPSNDYITHT